VRSLRRTGAPVPLLGHRGGPAPRGRLLLGLWRALPYVAVTLYTISVGLYRWFSGAVLRKGHRVTDIEHWDSTTDVPKLTRPLRATVRTLAVALPVGLLTHPLLVSLTCGTVLTLTAGSAAYVRRDSIKAMVSRKAIEGDREPIKVTAQIGGRS
jgi:hypothetical protein